MATVMTHGPAPSRTARSPDQPDVRRTVRLRHKSHGSTGRHGSDRGRNERTRCTGCTQVANPFMSGATVKFAITTRILHAAKKERVMNGSRAADATRMAAASAPTSQRGAASRSAQEERRGGPPSRARDRRRLADGNAGLMRMRADPPDAHVTPRAVQST